MGYTHYWRVRKDVDSKKLAAAHYDIAKIISAAEVPLGNGHGDEGSSPIIEEGLILFNGVGDDSHETFVWPPQFKEGYYSAFADGYSFDFCKTARKPYDGVVGACLIAAKAHLGDDIKVSSDGDEDEFMYGAGYGGEAAAKLYERVFGVVPSSPLEREE